VGSESGNYYLMLGSPCINTGTSTNAPSEDKEGIVRPQDLGIDMGAYEYVEPSSCTPRASFTANQITGTDSLRVEFDASSSGGSQYSGAILSWDFGDGTSGNGMVPMM
jgi:PKD repeat protein